MTTIMRTDPRVACKNGEERWLWAVFHDLVAHPLMALTNYWRLALRLHDWTSRRAWPRVTPPVAPAPQEFTRTVPRTPAAQHPSGDVVQGRDVLVNSREQWDDRVRIGDLVVVDLGGVAWPGIVRRLGKDTVGDLTLLVARVVLDPRDRGKQATWVYPETAWKTFVKE